MMRKRTFFPILFFLSTAALCRAKVVKAQKRVGTAVNTLIATASAKITEESVKSTTKSVSSSMAKFYLSRGEAGLTISITNSMSTSRDLVTPKLYLAEGFSINPPPLRIRHAANANERYTHTMFMDGKPKGVLCYECPGAGQNSQSNNAVPELICLYFNWVEKTYGVSFQAAESKDWLNEERLIQLYSDNKPVISAKETGQYFAIRDNFKRLNVLIIAMMTTGKNARLYFEIQDPPSTPASKREVITATTLGIGVLTAAPSIAMAAYRYFSAEQGTVLTLENLSNQDDPFVLYDPIWYQSGIEVQDFIPYTIVPGQVTDVNLLVPFGKGELTKPSIFLLSYGVQGYDDRVVLAIWWPMKLKPGKTIRYSLTLLRPYQTKVGETSVQVELKSIAQVIMNNPKNEAKANEDLRIKSTQAFPNNDNLKVNHS